MVGRSVQFDWHIAPENDDPEAHLMRQPMGIAWEEKTNTLFVSDFKAGRIRALALARGDFEMSGDDTSTAATAGLSIEM